MKQIYILTTLLFLTFSISNAQNITLTGACEGVNGEYVLSEDVNGRPTFVRGDYLFQWSGTRWEHTKFTQPDKIGMYNEADTETPPASSFSPWVTVLCSAGEVTGEGAATTLDVNQFELSKNDVKIFPNPASHFIKISGLSKTENYSIYNILGSKISSGKISNNEKIDIQNLSNGLYLLKFNNGNTIKLIKE